MGDFDPVVLGCVNGCLGRVWTGTWVDLTCGLQKLPSDVRQNSQPEVELRIGAISVM